MPSVEILNRASKRDARPAFTEQERSETLANERDADQHSERTAWVPVDAEQQSTEFHAHDGGSIRLTKLARPGEIKTAARGYNTTQPARPGTPRPLRRSR